MALGVTHLNKDCEWTKLTELISFFGMGFGIIFLWFAYVFKVYSVAVFELI
eukprot:m.35372 g.35372  ORF g.35372 m.35372 type:complete len:51 (-) comp17121_c0_seq1:980-1132(-)